MEKLNWGMVTADGIDKERNLAIHVFNFSVHSAEQRIRAKRYIAGRVKNFAAHLPAEYSQKVYLDVRGQSVEARLIEVFRNDLSSKLAELLTSRMTVIEIIHN